MPPMFRFTIRDVLWLMVVVGLGCSWFLHVRSIHLAELRRSEEQVKRAKASIRESWERAQSLGIQMPPLPATLSDP